MKQIFKITTLFLICVLALGLLPATSVMAAQTKPSNPSIAAATRYRLGNPTFQKYCDYTRGSYAYSYAVQSQPGQPENVYSWRCAGSTNNVWWAFSTIDVLQTCRLTYPAYNNMSAIVENNTLGGWICYGDK